MTPEEKSTVCIAKILFATDFSEVSAKALPYAAAFARRFAAGLCVAHVIPPDSPEHEAEKNAAAAMVTTRRDAETRINRLLEASHFRGVRHEVVLTEGEILPTLASIAERREADLLVLGMHGRHGLAKALLGSVAEEILRLAEIPVLVVGPEAGVEPEEELAMQRVLYAADFSPGCGRALQYAAAIARAHHARLLVLHVVEDAWREPTSTRLGAEEYLRVRLMERGWMAAIEPVAPELLVDFGPAEDRILQVAQQHRVELIVLDVPSTMHPVLAAHLPGPLAYNVASHAHCPVLAVRGADK
jgi:nucleotide-binding universal stress UspA family protein